MKNNDYLELSGLDLAMMEFPKEQFCIQDILPKGLVILSSEMAAPARSALEGSTSPYLVCTTAEAAGTSFDHAVKTTCFLADIADFAAMNEVYKQYYQSECPARSAFAVKSLPMGALVEIETIAGK